MENSEMKEPEIYLLGKIEGKLDTVSQSIARIEDSVKSHDSRLLELEKLVASMQVRIMMWATAGSTILAAFLTTIIRGLVHGQ